MEGAKMSYLDSAFKCSFFGWLSRCFVANSRRIASPYEASASNFWKPTKASSSIFCKEWHLTLAIRCFLKLYVQRSPPYCSCKFCGIQRRQTRVRTSTNRSELSLARSPSLATGIPGSHHRSSGPQNVTAFGRNLTSARHSGSAFNAAFRATLDRLDGMYAIVASPASLLPGFCTLNTGHCSHLLMRVPTARRRGMRLSTTRECAPSFERATRLVHICQLFSGCAPRRWPAAQRPLVCSCRDLSSSSSDVIRSGPESG